MGHLLLGEVALFAPELNAECGFALLIGGTCIKIINESREKI